MNLIYRSIWNAATGTAVAVSENAKSAGKKAPGSTGPASVFANFARTLLSAALMLSFGAGVHALPVGGVVAAGAAGIVSSGATTTVTQSTGQVVINWQGFNIGAGQTVQFVQPSSSSVALNRVTGSDPSGIFGNLSANGKVFLVNPNGILFGAGSSVNVAGLVASTLNITDANFMAGKYTFAGSGGSVVNQGNINADGGYVALLGANVSNQGVISARMGSIALAAGSAITLDVAGDRLLNVTVDQGAVNALVENGGLIQSDGGSVLLTAQAAGYLLATVVNNTGVIRAQTLTSNKGTIKLLGDMLGGTVNVAGTLDASAPNGGDGGFIETSAAHVNVADSARITTAAPLGQTGSWLIDPQDFIVGSLLGDNISGLTLQGLLVNNNVIISTSNAPDTSVPGTPFTRNTSRPGNGDIFVNDAVVWTAAGAPTTLTLNAERDVNINAVIKPTDGNFAVCCGRDINVNAAITAVRGSVLLSAGRNVNQRAAMTATNGNIEMCAAGDINIGAALTLTNGTLIATRNLGLPRGLVLRADSDGTGPGVAGGTVNFDPLLVLPYTVTNAPVAIFYNPVSYTAPADYSTKFTLTGGAVLAQKMLVFPDGANKIFDGTTTANFTSLKGLPPGVSLVADPGNTSAFDNASAGLNKSVSFSGYSLAGANASDYAFAVSCCGINSAKTTGSIVGGGGFSGPLPVGGLQLASLGNTLAGSAFGVLALSDTGFGELALESTTEAALIGLPLTVASAGSQSPYVLTTSPLDSAIGLPPPAPPAVPVAPAVLRNLAPAATYVAPVYAPKQDRH